jgi:hypothetical protein
MCYVWRAGRSWNVREILTALHVTCWNTLTKRIQYEYCLAQRIQSLQLLHSLYPSRVAQLCAWWCFEFFDLVIVGGVAASCVDFILLRDGKFICCRDITLHCGLVYARRCWISHRQCRICVYSWHFRGQSLTEPILGVFWGGLSKRSMALEFSLFDWFPRVYLNERLSQKNTKGTQQLVNFYWVKNFMNLYRKCDKVLRNFGVHLRGFCELRGTSYWTFLAQCTLFKRK